MEDDALVVARIDPAYLRLVELVSSPTRPDLHVEGLRILAHLCRRAVQRPLPLKHMAQVAECEFAGIARLCRGEEEARYGKWPYSRETTLKWFVLLEALSVIRRFRRKGKTVIQIPLGKREPPSQGQLLATLDDCARQYTNSKTYELLMRAKADIERYGVPYSEPSEGDLLDEPALLSVQRQLVAKLQESGVSRATSRKVALWLTCGPLAQIAKNYLHAVRTTTTTTGKAIPPQHEAGAPAHGTRDGQFDSHQGDSTKEALISPGRFFGNEHAALERSAGRGDHRLYAQQGDSCGQEPARTGQHDTIQGDFARQRDAQPEALPARDTSTSRPVDQQGDFEGHNEVHQRAAELLSERSHMACNLLSTEQGDFEQAQSQAQIAIPTTEIALPARQGDCVAVVSSSNSISFQKDPPKESELEFDSAERQSTLESPSSPTERRAEAMYLWTQLYSDEQRTAPGGQRLIGGLVNKLNERPDLVRLAMVNVLLQRFFPDRHGPPDGCGAKWFYRSYARYLSGQLTPSPEITSWAESPYSYEQIERALSAEYAYQQADVFRKSGRPSASCVVEHRLLSIVLAGTVVEVPREQQSTEHTDAPAATSYGQGEQSREAQQEEPVPAECAFTSTEVYETPAAVHEDSMGATFQAKQGRSERRTQKVVVVEDPQAGWTSLEGVLWWCEQITRTSLASTSRVEVLPTEYGRYVLVMTPHDDEAAAWLWCSGREVREYLEQLRARSMQRSQPHRSGRTLLAQPTSPEQPSQLPLQHVQASSP